jgi:hypothetical protein
MLPDPPIPPKHWLTPEEAAELTRLKLAKHDALKEEERDLLVIEMVKIIHPIMLGALENATPATLRATAKRLRKKRALRSAELFENLADERERKQH